MEWTKIEAGQINRSFNRLMVASGDRAEMFVDKINNDEAVANRVVALCLNDGFEPSTSQVEARKIMGKNMFGIEEAKKFFGASLTRRQLAYMEEIPWNEEVLKECKDSHVLVAVVPQSIVETREKTVGAKLPKDHRMFYKQDWYDGNHVGNDKGHVEWHLVRRTPVADSASKTWDEQQALLDTKIEETPEAQIMVYTIIGHFLATSERLFEKIYVRCKTRDSGGYRVLVGFLAARGLDVNSCSDDSRDGSVAVCAARKQ